MRFLLDMGISPRVTEWLRGNGHEATHLYEEGLCELPDPQILAKARQEARVLLTHDLDFSDLLAASGASLPSVVIFRLNNMCPERQVSNLERVLDRYLEALEEGAVLSVSDGLIRIRTLPV